MHTSLSGKRASEFIDHFGSCSIERKFRHVVDWTNIKMLGIKAKTYRFVVAMEVCAVKRPDICDTQSILYVC